MSDIRLTDAAKFDQGLPHQVAAWNWLQDQLEPPLLTQFAELFRAAPPVKPQPSPSPGAIAADWLTICRRFVGGFEDCRLQAYPDPGTGGDPWTIGWGHTGPEVRPGVVWSKQQADEVFDRDLSEARAQLLESLPMAGDWSANRQAALVSWAFNIGAGAVHGSTLRRRLMGGEDPAKVIPEELPKWNKGGNGVMPGLVRRRAAEVELFVGKPAAPTEPMPGRVRPGDPFTTRLSAHFTLGEFALGQEARRFREQHQVDTAAELAAFLERLRTAFNGKPVTITSGYRPAEINRQVGGASSSEHLYDAPSVGAVDVCINGIDINRVQDWCDQEWPYSIGYGAPKGFVHIGIRRGRPRVRWDY